MKTVEIASGFTAYPNGKKRHFSKGEEPELADAFADMITGKGLGHEKPGKAEPKTAQTSADKD